jgi:Protein of unknown function (DUF3179)
VYARQLDDRILTLAVDGRLWKESMVLYDPETTTRWSQMTGVAQTGPLKGSILNPLPSVMTDWQTWRRMHADGTVVVLPHKEQRFDRAFYGDLKGFVLGIAAEGKAKYWSLDRLTQDGVVNDDWDGRPVVAVFDPASVTARLFSRELDGQVLTFRVEQNRLLDQQTGTRWEPASGKGVAGSLAGRSLRPIAGAAVSRSDAWLRFHSRSEARP